MPIYEYRCNQCGHIFEVMQKVNDSPITTCTECSGPTSKIISPAGLVFKGSGWYITDYSSKDKARDESSKKKEEGKTEEKKSTPEQRPTPASNS